MTIIERWTNKIESSLTGVCREICLKSHFASEGHQYIIIVDNAVAPLLNKDTADSIREALDLQKPIKFRTSKDRLDTTPYDIITSAEYQARNKMHQEFAEDENVKYALEIFDAKITEVRDST